MGILRRWLDRRRERQAKRLALQHEMQVNGDGPPVAGVSSAGGGGSSAAASAATSITGGGSGGPGS